MRISLTTLRPLYYNFDWLRQNKRFEDANQNNESTVSQGLDAIRIQADAVIVTSSQIHSPGQVVVRDGRIVECTADCSVRADLELPGSMLSAGLVNAHTHLEFSDLRQPFPPGANFPDWIGAVIRHRRAIAEQHSSDECLKLRQAALRAGYEESRQAGIALAADIVTRPWSPTDLSGLNGDPRCVSGAVPIIARNRVSLNDCSRHFASAMAVLALPEIIGLDEVRFNEAATWAMQFDAGGVADTPVMQVGMSPHAPYSIHVPTMQHTLADGSARQRVTAMHVAESLDELEWLERGSGPFRQVFERLGVPLDAPRASIAELIQWLATRDRALLVHGNYLTESESEQAARSEISIVYCPRTHRHFSHSEYPLKRFIDQRINVVLGTDSRASNPDLDVWNEVLCVRELHPRTRPEWLFDAVTQRAAMALGVEQHFGSLQPGRVATMNISRFDATVSPASWIDELTTRPRPFIPLGDVLVNAL